MEQQCITYGVEPVGEVKRWLKEKKMSQKISLSQQSLNMYYNGKGGVDLMDRALAGSMPRIQGQKIILGTACKCFEYFSWF